MKIGIVGSGALGSYYGAKLARAGLDTHFLLRSDYDFVRRNGITIQSVDGHFNIRPKCAARPSDIGLCDLVVIGLKTTANDRFPELLTPLVDSNTLVLTLQNGLGNEEELAQIFGPDNILGGLCFVCLNRLEPGLVHHIGYGQISIGEFRRPPSERTHHIAKLFRRAGVPCDISENLERAHWEKLVWNIPFNGLGVASAAGYDAVISGRLIPGRELGECLTTDQLLSEPHWNELVRDLMGEVIGTARQLGFDLSFELAAVQRARTVEMGAYKPSTLVDFERRQPLEINSLFLKPLTAAEQAGVAVPRLAALCQILTQMDPGGASAAV